MITVRKRKKIKKMKINNLILSISELERAEVGLTVSATDAQIYHSKNDYTKYEQ